MFHAIDHIGGDKNQWIAEYLQICRQIQLAGRAQAAKYAYSGIEVDATGSDDAMVRVTVREISMA